MTKLKISILLLTTAMLSSPALLASAVTAVAEITQPINRMTPAEIGSIRLQRGDPTAAFIGRLPDCSYESPDIGAFAMLVFEYNGALSVLMWQDLWKWADADKTMSLFRAQAGGPAKIEEKYPSTTLAALLQGPANLQTRGLLEHLRGIGALKASAVNYTEQGISVDGSYWGPAKTFAFKTNWEAIESYLTSPAFTDAPVTRCDNWKIVTLDALIEAGIPKEGVPAVSGGGFKEMTTVDGEKVSGIDEPQMRRIYGEWIRENWKVASHWQV